jgi:hypothetical protein
VAWRDVLDPRLRGPAWSIEHWLHGTGRWVLAGRFVRTTAKAHVPPMLWRSLAMHHRVRWSMLLRGVACGLVLSYVAVSPVAIGARTGLMMWLGSAGSWVPSPMWESAAAAALWPLAGPWHSLWWPMWVNLAWLAAWLVFMPLCFVIFRRTLRASRVRAAHIVRISLYSAMTWPIVLMLHSVLIVDGSFMANEILRWTAASSLFSIRTPWVSSACVVLGTVLIGAWYANFWWWAIRRYLRLRHAFLTALAITIVSLLASVIVTGNGEHAWALVASFFGIDLV